MDIAYDPAKNAWNVAHRGLSFDDVAFLDWRTAVERQDRRKDYGEVRMQAYVMGTDGKPYVVVYNQRGTVTWVISFRRSNEREGRIYAKTKKA